MPHPKAGYRLADGSEVPGVTSINSRFGDKGALLFWAFKRGKDGAARLYDDTSAMDIGTCVHSMVEADLHGKPCPALPPDFTKEMIQATTNAFENYQREIKRSKAFFMPLEVQLISEKYKYGGTPDAIVEFDDVIDVGDWKSSNGVYLDHVIQLAAYRNLWNENHPESPAVGARLYRFAKESGAFAEHYYGPETLDLAFKQFVLFREAFDNDKRLKKLV
jgi:hypothetical protein